MGKSKINIWEQEEFWDGAFQAFRDITFFSAGMLIAIFFQLKFAW